MVISRRMWFGWLVVGIAMVAISGTLYAGPPSGRFVGDSGSGAVFESKALGGTSPASASANRKKDLDDAAGSSWKVGNTRSRDDGQTISYVDKSTGQTVTKQLPITAEEFMQYLKNAPPGASIHPPQNKITVVDMSKWSAMSPAEREAATIWRTVTKIRQYQVKIPRYESRRVVSYPCCCWVTFWVLVAYDTEWRQEVTYSREAAGADYPLTQIYVDRTIYYDKGLPEYMTRVPRLCKHHYGPNAPDYPTVPIVTDNNDNPSTSTGVSTETNGDVTIIKENVRTKRPVAGSVDSGLPKGELKDPGSGVNTFGRGRAMVMDNLLAMPRPSGAFVEGRPSR